MPHSKKENLDGYFSEKLTEVEKKILEALSTAVDTEFQVSQL